LSPFSATVASVNRALGFFEDGRPYKMNKNKDDRLS